MQPDLIFFDIDGTLMDFTADQPTELVIDTVRALRARGTKTVLATGRPPMLLPHFEQMEFDAFVTLNGSYAFGADGHIIRSSPISSEAAQRVVRNATSIGRPVCLATQERLVANGTDQDMIDFFAFSNMEVPVSEDFDQVLAQGDIFQFMVGARAHEYPLLVEGVPDVKVSPWWHRATDIISAKGGKAEGVQAVCEYLGVDISRTAAFGDGHNDSDMLAAVGFGVAMGNAYDEVKAVAQAVARDVRDDGVYHFCAEQGWI